MGFLRLWRLPEPLGGRSTNVILTGGIPLVKHRRTGPPDKEEIQLGCLEDCEGLVLFGMAGLTMPSAAAKMQ